MSTFTANYNVTGSDRKELVNLVAETIGSPAKYQGAPSFAYTVDYITIDRNGILPPTLHLKDNSTPTVIYSHESIEEILADLYNRGIQSLIVEGGTKLLQSFIDAGLWDEARTETAPVRLGEGVKAPVLPECSPLDSHTYCGHLIATFLPLSLPLVASSGMG